MLALAIDAILDFAGDRSGHFRMIECEVASHDAYGTPRKLFGEFFGVIADTLREILGGRLVAGDGKWRGARRQFAQSRSTCDSASSRRWRERPECETTALLPWRNTNDAVG